MTDVWQLSAGEQLALVANEALSCSELIEAHLERIEAVNPAVNAVTRVLADSARAAARVADAEPSDGMPLRGLPFTIKGDIDCFGSPTCRGVPALREALPYADAPVVARLKALGAIPIARTNLSEMGLRLCTDNPLHGRTINPHHRSLTVGGSSGGDAVAVAMGMTPRRRPRWIATSPSRLLRLRDDEADCGTHRPCLLFAAARLWLGHPVDACDRSPRALRRGPSALVAIACRPRYS